MQLSTQRLELIAGTFELIHADLKGRSHLAERLGVSVPGLWPPPETQFTVMLYFKKELKRSPQWTGWFSWYWILKADRVLIGLGGFKGAPTAEGAVEVGYSVLQEFQRKGYATEAVATLSAWAFSHPEVERITAEASVDRLASIRVLEKNRFRRAEQQSKVGVIRFELERLDAGAS